jgi:hypothetical protein
VVYCASDEKWYAVKCPAGQRCGHVGTEIGCFDFDGSVGAGGGSPDGAAAVGWLEPGSCQPCVQAMKGLSNDGFIDCSHVVDACSEPFHSCEQTFDCMAIETKKNGGDLDCAADPCLGEIVTEPAANDFLVCLADKCGAQCGVTPGYWCMN